MLKPTTRFLTNSLDQQLLHIRQEFDEVREAKNDYKDNPNEQNKEHLIEELIDLQTSCETMLACLGLNEQQRNYYQRKVISKNANRGYYLEAN